jgi:hypothetical protein
MALHLTPWISFPSNPRSLAGNRAEQSGDGRVPATVVAGGEVQGQESGQELTVVVLGYVSWTGMAGTVKFDLSPR